MAGGGAGSGASGAAEVEAIGDSLSGMAAVVRVLSSAITSFPIASASLCGPRARGLGRNVARSIRSNPVPSPTSGRGSPATVSPARPGRPRHLQSTPGGAPRRGASRRRAIPCGASRPRLCRAAVTRSACPDPRAGVRRARRTERAVFVVGARVLRCVAGIVHRVARTSPDHG